MAQLTHRRLMLALAFGAAVWLLTGAVTGLEVGLLYLAPALLLAVPLCFGNYLGEKSLMRLIARRRPQVRRRAPIQRGRAIAPARVTLIASALLALCRAERAPPVALVH